MRNPSLARIPHRKRQKSGRVRQPAKRQTALQYSFYIILVFLFHKCTQTSDNILMMGTMDTALQEFVLTNASQTQTTRDATRRQDNSTTSFQEQLDASYWLENLDISKPISCGANKCFFPRKDDPLTGYLISPQKFRFEQRTSASDVFNTLQASFELAQNLTRTHHVHHFLQTPPLNITVSKTLERHLNKNLISEARNATLKNKKRFKKTAFVQQVVKAPTSTLIFGCTPSKRGLFFSRVQEFVSNLPNKQLFAQNFGMSMIELRQLLLEETCLFLDFHVLIGAEGDIFHLDFDRCFRNSGKKRKKKPSKSCLQFLGTVEKRVRSLLNEDGAIDAVTN